MPIDAEQILSVIKDWHFPSSVVCLGSLLGTGIFLKTPLPRGSDHNVREVVVAAAMGAEAKKAGIAPLEQMAHLAGMHAMQKMVNRVQRQRRVHLLLGMGLAGAALLPVFLFTNTGAVPDWVFIVFAVLGTAQAFRQW